MWQYFNNTDDLALVSREFTLEEICKIQYLKGRTDNDVYFLTQAIQFQYNWRTGYYYLRGFTFIRHETGKAYSVYFRGSNYYYSYAL